MWRTVGLGVAVYVILAFLVVYGCVRIGKRADAEIPPKPMDGT